MYHCGSISLRTLWWDWWLDSPVEEWPNSPDSREQDELGSHGGQDLPELLLCWKRLGHSDSSTIGPYDVMERRDQEGKGEAVRENNEYENQDKNDRFATYAKLSMIKNATYVSGVTPPSTPAMWFFERLLPIICQHRMQQTSYMTYLIPPPISWPRLRETIHKARYFPRAPVGEMDMIVPASATYQQPVPIPLTKAPKMRNYHGHEWLFLKGAKIYLPIVCRICCCSNMKLLGWEKTWRPIRETILYQACSQEDLPGNRLMECVNEAWEMVKNDKNSLMAKNA